jgi:NitT/TauT family transport system substrate-binding protein
MDSATTIARPSVTSRRYRRRVAAVSLVLIGILIGGCTPAAPAPAVAPPTAPPTAAAAQPATKPPAAASPSPAASAAPSPAASPAAAAPAPAAKPSGPATVVRIASLRGASDSGLFIAIAKGYFADQGIDARFEQIALGGDITALVAADQIEVGGSALNASVLNASARGIGIKIAADKGSNTTFLMARTDLVESGAYKGLADLKGKKIGIPDLVSGGTIELENMLKKGGLTPADAEIVSMPFPDQLAALGNKAIDIGETIEPFVSIAEAQGLARRVASAKQEAGNHQVAVLMYSPKFAVTETAKRFTVAYVKGLRDYNDAFVKKQNLDEIASAIASQSTLNDPNMIKRITPVDLDPNGAINRASVESDLEWYVRKGFVQQRPNLDQLLDTSYTDYAVQQLGPYQR